MKISVILLFALLFSHCIYFKIPPSFKEDQLIIWNVGQGQMITYLSKKQCHHFDMGGEIFPAKKIFQLCQKKKNKVSYTHWDYDHINFSLKMKRIFPSLCRVPSDHQQPPLHRKKQRMIKKIPICKTKNHPSWKEIILPKTVRPKNSNESSQIFIVRNQVLIPGDSSKRMEAKWASLIQDPIQVLVTGHHGSQSSTSSVLLKHLPHLQLAVSSARKKRYNHPHPEVIKRLRKKGILHISTEQFGHIQIPLGRRKSSKQFFLTL